MFIKFTITLVFILTMMPHAFTGSVYYTEPEALKRAFGKHAVINKQRYFLSKEELQSINKQTDNSVSSRIVAYYTGKKNGIITGYAYIDTHKAKSSQETILVMITPNGIIKDVVFMQSDESSQFHPKSNWFGQFKSKNISERFRLYRDIDAISGATYTSFSITKAIRRIIAIHKTITTKR